MIVTGGLRAEVSREANERGAAEAFVPGARRFGLRASNEVEHVVLRDVTKGEQVADLLRAA